MSWVGYGDFRLFVEYEDEDKASIRFGFKTLAHANSEARKLASYFGKCKVTVLGGDQFIYNTFYGE